MDQDVKMVKFGEIVYNVSFYVLFRYTITHCDRIYGEWIFR